MSEESISYIPSQEHRFAISPDIISRQRFGLVKSIAHDLDTFPFYRDLTIKGSLAKGKILTESTAAKTDIDIGVVFDASSVLDLTAKQLRELALKKDLKFTESDLSPVKPSENIHNLFASSNLSTATLKRLRLVRDLTKSFISKQAEKKQKSSA